MKSVSNEGVPKGRLQVLMEGRLTDGNGNVLYQTLLKCNGKNELSAFRENWNGKSYVTKYTYEYDGMGQVIGAKNLNVGRWEYSYDQGGNLTHKKMTIDVSGGTLELSREYEYGNAKWKDQLTKYNGKAIGYDGIGNPVSYDGWTYEWQAGRQLKKMSKEGVTAEYNGVWYGYVKNLQGDIVGIVDSNGTEAVKYSYDAWGAQLYEPSGSMASTLGKADPFRYRGYVYDEETGLYYAQERYYNPEWCRFISADDSDAVKAMQTEQTDKNLYAYCDNNPIIREDKEGGILEFCSGSSGRSGDRSNDADYIECGIWQ